MLGELSIRTAYIEGGIISVIPLPFCLLTLIVLAYYIRRRIYLYQEIKRIPPHLLIMQSYINHRQNLRIKGIIANFVIVILIMEFLNSLAYMLAFLPFWVLNFDRDNKTTFLFLYHIGNFMVRFGVILRQSLIPLISILMNFLWLVYRKYEYKLTLIRWFGYMSIRTFIIIILTVLNVKPAYPVINYETVLFGIIQIFFGCIYICDFVQFVHYARKLYLHLKSREKEIRLFYFDRKEYLDSKFLRIHFKIATILVGITLFFFTCSCSLLSFSTLSYYIIYINPEFSAEILTTSISALVIFPSLIVYKIMITLNYLYIFIVIIYKSVRDRQKLANINNSIKPLVKKYHDTLYNAV